MSAPRPSTSSRWAVSRSRSSTCTRLKSPTADMSIQHSPRAARRQSTAGWLLAALPGTILLVFFGIVPLAFLLMSSLGLGRLGTGESAGPTFSYLTQAFTNGSLLSELCNSLLIAGGAAAITTLAAVPICIALSRRARTGHPTSLSEAILTLPMSLPGTIMGFFAIILIGRTGILGAMIPALNGMAYMPLGILIAYISFSLPRAVSPLRAAVEGLDSDAIDTSRVLGASATQSWFTVTLPTLLPAMVSVFGTVAAVALGGYGTIATLSEGSMRLLPLSVSDALTNHYAIAQASALAIVLALTATGILIVSRLLTSRLERSR
ncbi:ABC transporter permease subunit [Pseudoclavibacter sp. CFCC 13611]|nr:ABC transporter permease subunit [Pseudoclavibacter sp. CFCC 13611]